MCKYYGRSIIYITFLALVFVRESVVARLAKRRRACREGHDVNIKMDKLPFWGLTRMNHSIVIHVTLLSLVKFFVRNNETASGAAANHYTVCFPIQIWAVSNYDANFRVAFNKILIDATTAVCGHFSLALLWFGFGKRIIAVNRLLTILIVPKSETRSHAAGRYFLYCLGRLLWI